MQKDEIIITNAIVHILETEVGMPILSEYVLERHEELNDLLRSHIYRVAAGDDLKSCVFREDGDPGERMDRSGEDYETSEGNGTDHTEFPDDGSGDQGADTGRNSKHKGIYDLVRSFDEDDFIGFSKEAAVRLYDIMLSNPDIPSADFCVVTFQSEGNRYLAMLKMNYRDSFIHMTQNADDGSNYNAIIMQRATLPAVGSKLSEAVIIDLSDYSIRIVEKKYEVNGVKTNYLSELYLNCHARMSQKTRMKIVEKAVDQINHKYFEDNIEKQLETKAVIEQQIREEGAVTPTVIAEKLYDEYPTVREEFTQKLEKYNMADEEVRPQAEATVRKFRKQYLKTDTGIEINIPMDEYNNNDNVEFITNPDGTISIMIKNISRLMSK